MQKTGNLLFFLVLFFSVISSAEVNLKVDINPGQVGKGDQMQLTLTVQSTEDFNAADPEFPNVDGLKLIQAQNSGKSSSTRMQIVNGKTEFNRSVTQQYDYLLQVEKSGAIIIPSLSVTVNEKTYATAPQKIQAAGAPLNSGAAARPGRAQKPDPRNPFGEDDDDMFSQLMKQRQKMVEEMQRQAQGGNPGSRGQIFGGPLLGPNGQPEETPSRKLNDVNTKDAFFLYLDLDKNEAYEGEQITANWYIYTRGNIESLDRAKFPDLKGFWKEIIEEVPGLQFTEEIVNGIPFRKALLASHALFPIKPGTSAIDEFRIKAKVRLPTQFGWGQAMEYTKSSRRVPIKVLPVPTEGKPQSYSGAVGQFQIQTQVDGLKFPANQPFTLKVRFEGSGNAKLIELPPINWPAELEVFDTKSESKYFKNGQSYKEFEILLIPRKEGQIKIPQIVFSYFDPASKQYTTKTTEELALDITTALPGSAHAVSGAASSSAAAAVGAAEQVNSLQPILQLPGGSSWSNRRDQVFLGLFLFLGLGLLAWFVKKMTELNIAPHLKTIVTKKLNLITKAAHDKNLKTVGSEAVNLIYILLAHLAQQKNATTEWRELIQLVPVNYRDKYEAPLAAQFEYFQMIGFAPDSIKENLISQKPLEPAVQDLKTLALRLVQELPNE